MQWLFGSNKKVTYETFASQALFHPEKGYYSNSILTVGEGGDFSTSATMSGLLARAIAHWIITRDKLLPVIEIGAGDGSLCRDVMEAIPLLQRWRINYHIVDESLPLRKIQQGKVSRKVEWHDTVSDALRCCGGAALIFSNELVDAFAPRVFRISPEEVSELHVTEDFSELWQKVGKLPESTAFEQAWPDGQRLEIHESYRRWQEEWIEDFLEGEILTIDYGDEISDLYSRRPGGSLRAFYKHQQLSGRDIYQNPGQQDLTCDVNFTDLMAWGEIHGLEKIFLKKQSEFLKAHSRGTTTDSYLLHPDGPGSAFKVLLQRLRRGG